MVGVRGSLEDGAGGVTVALVSMVVVGIGIPADDDRVSADGVDVCTPPTDEVGAVVVGSGVVAALVEAAGTVVAGRAAIAPEIDVSA